MGTTTDMPPDLAAQVESMRPADIGEVIDNLRRIRVELEPLLDRADEILSTLRTASTDLLASVDPDAEVEAEEFISVALRRYELYDALAEIALEADPEEMFRRERRAQEQPIEGETDQ